MKHIILPVALLFAMLVPVQAAKLSVVDCEAVWNDARPKGSALNAELAKRYMADFEAVDTDGNKHISSDEFYAGCAKGLVHAPREPATDSPARP